MDYTLLINRYANPLEQAGWSAQNVASAASTASAPTPVDASLAQRALEVLPLAENSVRGHRANHSHPPP
jgi:hypothetical protein